MTDGRAHRDGDFIAILHAHGVYLSDADESELIERVVKFDDIAYDVALFALRTCMCGARIDGFDEYWDHLYEVFSQPD